MKNNALLFGIIGFILGGLVVSVAVTTLNKPADQSSFSNNMSMSQMTNSLVNKRGNDFDEAFMQAMTAHHEGAIAMAKLAESHASHDEIKTLSTNIISAQQSEISQMKQWQSAWDDGHQSSSHMMNGMHH